MDSRNVYTCRENYGLEYSQNIHIPICTYMDVYNIFVYVYIYGCI